MARTVTATEAKNRLGALLRIVSEEGEEIVIENRREPAGVIVSFADYQDYQSLKEQRRRQEAIEKIRRVMEIQAERNKDLTVEEADEMAIRAVTEVREERRRRAGTK